MATRVFISHRHADEPIARAVRENLQDWGVPQQAIFQSSDAASGAMIGETLDQALREALHDASLVVLAYTFTDQDWSYCMWECGVATDPTTADTRIVVFQCTEDAPEPFRAQIRVRIAEEDILRFTTQFHRDEGFCRGEPAFAPEIDDETLGRRATRLYEALSAVIPLGRLREMPRWDSLTLELAPQFVRQVREINGERDRERAFDTIEHNLIAVRGFGEACKHFGFRIWEDKQPFHVYIDRWKQATADLNPPNKWIQELCDEIWRAICNMPSEPTWEYMRSARRDTEWWFFPVLNHARELPDSRMEFDLYLFRVQGPEPP